MEGLVVKGLETAYETSGTRTGMWMKLKNTALSSGMRDSLDLVPIGAYYGKGNRAGRYGSFLMASYNSSTKRFESICKLGTGFTWEQLSQVSLEELSNDPEKESNIAK
jgi:DNA ligase 1